MTIDITSFTRVPKISIKQMLRLAKTLIRDIPQPANAAIEAAAGELEDHIKRVDLALTQRMAAANAEVITTEVDFDRAVDALWAALRRQLIAYDVYEHPGLRMLTEARAEAAGLESLRARAALARGVHDRLFGAEGTSFTATPFAEQAETMGTILRLITHQDLLEDLEQLVGPELPRLLEVCQAQYEDMVSDRLTRERGMSEDLRQLRHQLRWLIGQYNTAVCTLAKYGDPVSTAVVERALRSVLRMREANAGSLSADVDESELEGDDALVGELDDSPEAKPEADLQPEQVSA
jgi:hypothetical protein